MAESRELDLEPLLKITKEFEGVWGKALGRDLYHLCSALMPSLNVDIMLKSADGILLSWRDDEYYGPGWHVPGGVIRHKETIAHRVKAVLEEECGLITSSIPHQQPDLVSELFNSNRCIRGHFLSLLFIYDLDKLLQDGARWIRSFDSNNSFFKIAPSNLIHQQREIYGCFFEPISAAT